MVNFKIRNMPNLQVGFVVKKYISKYIKMSKIGAMLRSFNWPALSVSGFSIRILILGKMELDP